MHVPYCTYNEIKCCCLFCCKCFRPRETLVEYFYYYFSLGFLIARAVLVSMYASAINDQSKIPLTLLNSVTSALYNTEVDNKIIFDYF